jgi:hypothetical protein
MIDKERDILADIAAAIRGLGKNEPFNLDLLRCPCCGSLHIRGAPMLRMYCCDCGETWRPIPGRQGFESMYRLPQLHDPCYRRENDIWRSRYVSYRHK